MAGKFLVKCAVLLHGESDCRAGGGAGAHAGPDERRIAGREANRLLSNSAARPEMKAGLAAVRDVVAGEGWRRGARGGPDRRYFGRTDCTCFVISALVRPGHYWLAFCSLPERKTRPLRSPHQSYRRGTVHHRCGNRAQMPRWPPRPRFDSLRMDDNLSSATFELNNALNICARDRRPGQSDSHGRATSTDSTIRLTFDPAAGQGQAGDDLRSSTTAGSRATRNRRSTASSSRPSIRISLT
jgi:hypothetical protein